MHMSYWRFAAMIATSTLVMFGLMYIHTYIWDHVYFSETRAWMALLMGAVMAIIMLRVHVEHVQEPNGQHHDLCRRGRGIRSDHLAGPLTGDRERHRLHAGDDSAPFDRHSHQRTGRHRGSPRAKVGRRNH